MGKLAGNSKCGEMSEQQSLDHSARARYLAKLQVVML